MELHLCDIRVTIGTSFVDFVLKQRKDVCMHGTSLCNVVNFWVRPLFARTLTCTGLVSSVRICHSQYSATWLSASMLAGDDLCK